MRIGGIFEGLDDNNAQQWASQYTITTASRLGGSGWVSDDASRGWGYLTAWTGTVGSDLSYVREAA
jgi:hypothetical protein